MRIPVLILTALLTVCKANGAEVNVYAAASLTDVMKEIASAYEKESGGKILFNFGASSLLARQILEGAPADMFLSADEAKMDELEQAGLIATETRRDLLCNLLVIVVPYDSKLFGSSSCHRPSRVRYFFGRSRLARPADQRPRSFVIC